jgi:DNA adenine methylase
MRYSSPLRYPGGKSRLAPFLKLLFESNGIVGGHYAEPYAGGASVALTLLFDEYASRIHINDLDRSIYAFWNSILTEADEFCARISRVRVSMAEWRRQKAVQEVAETADLLDLGFSTFFLNRTNRSGIITGGPIGGHDQQGEWALDARYNKPELIKRIEKVAAFRDRISLTNMDASAFLTLVVPNLPANSLAYLDPPYYVQGQQRLYASYYKAPDHAAVAEIVRALPRSWLVSYDDAPAIRKLYRPHRKLVYGIDYSAADRYRGAEVMFFSDALNIPKIKDPTCIATERDDRVA